MALVHELPVSAPKAKQGSSVHAVKLHLYGLDLLHAMPVFPLPEPSPTKLSNIPHSTSKGRLTFIDAMDQASKMYAKMHLVQKCIFAYILRQRKAFISQAPESGT